MPLAHLIACIYSDARMSLCMAVRFNSMLGVTLETLWQPYTLFLLLCGCLCRLGEALQELNVTISFGTIQVGQALYVRGERDHVYLGVRDHVWK